MTAGYDEYPPEIHVELRDALETEIQLLRVLVDGESVHVLSEPFDVAAARVAGRPLPSARPVVDVASETLAPAVRAFGPPGGADRDRAGARSTNP